MYTFLAFAIALAILGFVFLAFPGAIRAHQEREKRREEGTGCQLIQPAPPRSDASIRSMGLLMLFVAALMALGWLMDRSQHR